MELFTLSHPMGEGRGEGDLRKLSQGRLRTPISYRAILFARR